MTTITPFPFQADLVDRLGDPKIHGRLIGDEPGLGKTLEGLWIDLRLRRDHPYYGNKTLIIAPWSVHEMWSRMIQNLTGLDASRIVMINRKKRGDFVAALKNKNAVFFICHYEAIRLKDMAPVRSASWFHVICDEVHRIKSEKSQARRAVRQLKTKYKTGMSASIAEDKPQDFWSPLNWVAPALFPSMKTFKSRWCETEEVQGRCMGEDPNTGEPMYQYHQLVVGLKMDRLPEFHRTIAPFYMRRRKYDVGINLPEKYSTVINVELLPSQRKVYDDLRRKMLAWIGENEDQLLSVPAVLGRLTRLQQAALATMEWYDTGRIDTHTGEPIMKIRLIEPSAKLDALADWAQDRSEPLIVFSRSRSMIELVEQRLTKMGAKVGLYTGSVPDERKTWVVDSFQAGKLDVFAGTIAAGGEGITLTAASTVAFLDRAWGPFKNTQAEDRAHRIGQKNAVQIVDFFAPNTVDAKVRSTNIRKWSQLKALMGDQE